MVPADKKLNSYPPEQLAYAKRVSGILADRNITCPKAHIVTFGCQQNVSDSERIKGMLRLCGYTFTDNISDADFVIFNTCAVRGHAEDRVYGNIGAVKKYKRNNQNLILAVCGCMAQQKTVAEKIYKSYPYVDIVFGTQQYHRLPEFIYQRLKGSKRVYELALDNADIVEDIPISRDGTLKGWLPVMYGCNNFCTYCIVPYVRGRERSRSPENIIAEVRQVVNDGYIEVTLLGQNVNSYNYDGVRFPELLKRVNDEVRGLKRLRFMTSHPKDLSDELIDAMASLDKVCKHIHLPVQSGSDRILRLMNRKYTSADYYALVDKLRARVKDVEITTDIIVGFPQETEEDFNATCALVRNVGYSNAYTFAYSPREGTVAARMDGQIPLEEKKRRLNALNAVLAETLPAGNEKYIGYEGDILVEATKALSEPLFPLRSTVCVSTRCRVISPTEQAAA